MRQDASAGASGEDARARPRHLIAFIRAIERSHPCQSHAHPQHGARGERPRWRSVRGLFAGLGPLAGNASSHREAPLTAADPQIDNTDVYAFVSPDRPDTVTLVSSWIPFEEPAGGPNFYPWAEHTNYDINIDNDGGTQRRHHVPLEVHDALPQPRTRSSTTRVRSRR